MKEWTKNCLRMLSGDSRARGQAMTDRFVSVILIAVVGIIGTLVYDSVLGSLGDPSGTNAENRTALENATVDVTGGVSDAFGLVPAVLVILVAALVIQILRQFR